MEKAFKRDRIILFGSRARGDQLNDITVASRYFEGYNFLDRLALLYGHQDYEYALDILA